MLRACASLAEAVKVLEADTGFDLALLDLSIPGVKGFGGLLQLRASFPRLPVVVVTGHEDPKVVAQVIDLGAAGFIPKSSKKSALADAILKVMNGSVFLPEDYSRPEPDEQV